MKLYALIKDCGDSSNCLEWYTDKDLVNYLLGEDDYYYSNEGRAITLSFPDDFNLSTLGIFISSKTLKSYKKDYEHI